jgi:hypothetical protein
MSKYLKKKKKRKRGEKKVGVGNEMEEDVQVFWKRSASEQ